MAAALVQVYGLDGSGKPKVTRVQFEGRFWHACVGAVPLSARCQGAIVTGDDGLPALVPARLCKTKLTAEQAVAGVCLCAHCEQTTMLLAELRRDKVVAALMAGTAAPKAVRSSLAAFGTVTFPNAMLVPSPCSSSSGAPAAPSTRSWSQLWKRTRACWQEAAGQALAPPRLPRA